MELMNLDIDKHNRKNGLTKKQQQYKNELEEKNQQIF
jgi:hypothetical protein